MNDRLAYSVREAADIVGLGETKMRELLLRGDIASKKVGRTRLVPRWALDDWLAETTPVEDSAAWPFQR